MQIVERYILRRTLVAFLLTLFWTLAAVWTTQVVARIDLVTDSGQSAAAFLQLATLILPSVIPVVIPFALVIAIAQTLTAMNTDSELVVVNAAGASRLVVARPILILAAVAGLLSLWIHGWVDPSARQQVRELVSGSRADLITTVIQEGSFHKIDDGLFVQIGQRRADGRLGGIFVSDSREAGADLVYYAKNGAVSRRDGDSILVMEDGVVHRKAPGGDISVIRFTSYSFDLSEFAPATDEVVLLPKDRTVGYLMNPDANDPIWQNRPHRYRAELHARLTEWSYALVFALIALAVAGDARSHREARLHPMVTALVSALFIRWLGFFAVSAAEDFPHYLPLLYLIPLSSAAASIYFLVTHRTMELPASWTDKVTSLYARLGSGLVELRFMPGGLQPRPAEEALMIGWTLGRYFFTRYAIITMWIFLGIFALVFIIDFTEFSSRSGNLSGYSMQFALGVSALRIPMIMQQTVPFIALFAAMATLVSLNRKYELVIARSAGVSAWQFLLPIGLGALLFGLATVLVLNPIAAAAFAKAESLAADLRLGELNEVSGPETPWIKQRTDEGETIIGAKTILDQGLTLSDATFFRLDASGDIAERLDARRAYLRDGYWELDDVTRLAGGLAPESLESVRISTNLQPEFVQERLAQPDMIPFYELRGKIDAARSFGLRANAFAMHYHSLIALPVLLVAMTLIAATVSMRFTRLGQSGPMILGGILAGFLLYVVSVLVEAFGSAGIVAPVLAAWFPVVVAMFFGVSFLLHKEDG